MNYALIHFFGIILYVLLGTGLIACQVDSDYETVANQTGIDLSKVKEAATYAGGSGMVLRGGKIVYKWGNTKKLYPMKSTTKSIGSIVF